MMPNFYTGDMSREQGLGRLANLARRLGIPAAVLEVRPQPHSRHGMTLSFAYYGAAISRSCDSQTSRDRNFVCLVLWLADLVRNIERGIESPAEAFYAEGGHRLLAAALGTTRRANLYCGKDWWATAARQRVASSDGAESCSCGGWSSSWALTAACRQSRPTGRCARYRSRSRRTTR